VLPILIRCVLLYIGATRWEVSGYQNFSIYLLTDSGLHVAFNGYVKVIPTVDMDLSKTNICSCFYRIRNKFSYLMHRTILFARLSQVLFIVAHAFKTSPMLLFLIKSQTPGGYNFGTNYCLLQYTY